MIAIELNAIKQELGDRLLFAIDQARVGTRDRIGIVGRNGAGKTTLLRLLAGIDVPDEGTISSAVSRAFIPQLKSSRNDRSGGEETMLIISSTLRDNPAVVLADEPTTHLDAAHLQQLEEKFEIYSGAIVAVSHDRDFLNRICRVIWELEDGKLAIYKGNYDDYSTSKQQKRAEHEARYEAYTEKKQQLEEAVRLKERKAGKMTKPPKRMSYKEIALGKMGSASKQKGVHRVIKSLETRLEKLEKVEKPRDQPHVRMDIPNAELLRSKRVIQVNRASASAGGRRLWTNVTFSLSAGDKAALIGPNGSGKTTLIKLLQAGSPGFTRGSGVKLGYFSQNLDILNPERSIWENVMVTSVHPEALVRNILARLLFRRNDVYKTVSCLSGGERVKTALAKILVSDMNVLLLDEPTTFLDLSSIEALERLLADYEGTLLFISHDRHFIRRVATRILSIKNARVIDYDGSYAEYEQETNAGFHTERNIQAEHLLAVETHLAEVLGKLGLPAESHNREALDAEFHRLIGERNELRKVLGR